MNALVVEQLTPACPPTSPDSSVAALSDGTLIRELRQALEMHALSIEFQPQWDLKRETLVGVEALARWNHRDLGEIKPTRFIPLAEKSGSIGLLGRQILQQAVCNAKTWSKSGVGTPCVAINTSGHELLQSDFVPTVLRIVEDAQISPTRICFEITETIAAHCSPAAINTLLTLRAAGFRLAIDDFGTGYANLSALRSLPVHTVKIDRSFIVACVQNGKDRVILRAIVALAHSLGVETIAEGVETAAQACLLRDIGCHAAQGNYFSAPVSGRDIAQLGRTGFALHRKGIADLRRISGDRGRIK